MLYEPISSVKKIKRLLLTFGLITNIKCIHVKHITVDVFPFSSY